MLRFQNPVLVANHQIPCSGRVEDVGNGGARSPGTHDHDLGRFELLFDNFQGILDGGQDNNGGGVYRQVRQAGLIGVARPRYAFG